MLNNSRTKMLSEILNLPSPAWWNCNLGKLCNANRVKLVWTLLTETLKTDFK